MGSSLLQTPLEFAVSWTPSFFGGTIASARTTGDLGAVPSSAVESKQGWQSGSSGASGAHRGGGASGGGGRGGVCSPKATRATPHSALGGGRGPSPTRRSAPSYLGGRGSSPTRRSTPSSTRPPTSANLGASPVTRSGKCWVQTHWLVKGLVIRGLLPRAVTL